MHKKLFLLICLIFCVKAMPHAMPNSVLEFAITDDKVVCHLKLPLKEFQFAVGFDVTNDTDNLFENHQQKLEDYIQNHFHIIGKNGDKWQIQLTEMLLETSIESDGGIYKELSIKLIFIPKQNESTRNFTIFYDAILHQLVTHKAIISIKQDWQNGIVGHQNSEIGMISVDFSNNEIKPFLVNLEVGNNWKGFKAMFWLGIDHIADGVDHLMFLLLLLLPSPLLVISQKWNKSQGWKISLWKILKIVTGFTIGHSVTLFFGTMQWFETPILIVEILIMISIFITAIHALRPIFYKREIVIAVVFGLIHGLAFSQTLVELELTSTKMFLSLLGFNLGIEAMQLFVILMVMPFLIYLSQNKYYHIFRMIFAVFGMIASIGWISELLTDTPNLVSELLSKIPQIAKWLVLLLVVLSVFQFRILQKAKNKLLH